MDQGNPPKAYMTPKDASRIQSAEAKQHEGIVEKGTRISHPCQHL